MYYDNDPKAFAQIKNERILGMISDSPVEACSNDPEVAAAFEESLRDLAEDILEFSPDLAHILLGLGDKPDSIHGRN